MIQLSEVAPGPLGFFFYTVSYRNLKLSITSASPCVSLYKEMTDWGVTCPWIFFMKGHTCMHVTVFCLFVFFYTVSYRNLKLSMRFFWVKLHIKFTFHRRDHNGSGVMCPWSFYYRTYACKTNMLTILMHQMRISTTQVSSVMLR
jgi:hypothetical protein